MSLIQKIFSLPEFKDAPPVLIDIGASGKIHPKWKKIAKYSICISFDADERKMGYIVNEGKTFKKQYVYNCIVGDKKQENDFYLTQSPYCSSTLKPDITKLNDYAFVELFGVKDTIRLKSIDLISVLKELNITQIDWFKTDSQGADLRLFQNIDKEIINKVLVAEFEPGLIDAYEGEDKLHQLISYMDGKDFWISDMLIKGSQRISKATKDKKFNTFQKKIISAIIKTSPGWAEIVYFNTLKKEIFSKRDFLLCWIFACIQKQYGFALDTSIKGMEKFNDPIFKLMEQYAYNKINIKLLNFPIFIMKKVIQKYF